MENPSPLPYSRRSPMHGERKPLLLTGYRILVILLTAGLGVWKAKLSYHGYSTSPNTLDWLYGVCAFLTLYWLGIYERHAIHNHKRWMRLMFEVDYLAALWKPIKGFYHSVTSSEGAGRGLRLPDD